MWDGLLYAERIRRLLAQRDDTPIVVAE